MTFYKWKMGVISMATVVISMAMAVVSTVVTQVLVMQVVVTQVVTAVAVIGNYYSQVTAEKFGSDLFFYKEIGV